MPKSVAWEFKRPTLQCERRNAQHCSVRGETPESVTWILFSLTFTLSLLLFFLIFLFYLLLMKYHTMFKIKFHKVPYYICLRVWCQNSNTQHCSVKGEMPKSTAWIFFLFLTLTLSLLLFLSYFYYISYTLLHII